MKQILVSNHEFEMSIIRNALVLIYNKLKMNPLNYNQLVLLRRCIKNNGHVQYYVVCDQGVH